MSDIIISSEIDDSSTIISNEINDDCTIISNDLIASTGGDVTSVNGETGDVILDTDDINEGSSNLYYTEARVSNNTSVSANTAKVGVTNEEENTIDSITSGEPTGSDQVINVVSLTQAEYDAGTPIVTTFYIITD